MTSIIPKVPVADRDGIDLLQRPTDSGPEPRSITSAGKLNQLLFPSQGAMKLALLRGTSASGPVPRSAQEPRPKSAEAKSCLSTLALLKPLSCPKDCITPCDSSTFPCHCTAFVRKQPAECRKPEPSQREVYSGQRDSRGV